MDAHGHRVYVNLGAHDARTLQVSAAAAAAAAVAEEVEEPDGDITQTEARPPARRHSFASCPCFYVRGQTSRVFWSLNSLIEF